MGHAYSIIVLSTSSMNHSLAASSTSLLAVSSLQASTSSPIGLQRVPFVLRQQPAQHHTTEQTHMQIATTDPTTTRVRESSPPSPEWCDDASDDSFETCLSLTALILASAVLASLAINSGDTTIW
eukprot:CAMPEP_0169362202 /NCGR_PEP_ID=MMETSP1017-20121227/30776_1 /TAXON_ID=342587 /ORGANISM="Karlodinium micrum, Strain CCMP2283" /LENGTH=124 /DNA_ID=CAMNT_0009459693 /DNA_START=18 /DNA_END=389 /DNA_ORIENTATION=+